MYSYFQAFTGQVNTLRCPVPLASLLAGHRSLRVHWIMFTLYRQWHRSAFMGWCMVAALPPQCLTCSPISGLCVFPAAPSHHSSGGLLAYLPQTTALSRILHFCPAAISHLYPIPVSILPFLGMNTCLWSMWSQSFSLPCCPSVMISHRPTWSHNVQDICSSVEVWGLLCTQGLHYFTTAYLLKTAVWSFVFPLFSPVLMWWRPSETAHPKLDSVRHWRLLIRGLALLFNRFVAGGI